MSIADLINILMSGIFHAAILFLVAAGLQVVFGVQKVFNLACGSFYALGAYVGISLVSVLIGAGLPQPLFIFGLIAAGLISAVVGPIVERGMLKFIYKRDVHFQLLLTFAIVLIMEDLIRMSWGSAPQSTKGLYLIYGQISILGAIIPVYNLVVIFTSLAIAALIGFMLYRTRFGKIIRASAESSEMSEALGINMKSVNLKVFTLGTVLGTLGGALVIPAISAMPDMGVELIVLAFAVVVIGGLGSMKGAFVGALVVGILKSITISFYPELEIFMIYLIVIGVLVYKPEGLFGRGTV
jgi:branched-chain amino acid transport system permease protein